MTQPAADFKGSPLEIAFYKSGLLTGYGLDFLAQNLSGPNVDRATLQLVGVLFASIVLPGLAAKQVMLLARLP
eukprot:2122642-Amphidinium_carterae.1